MDELPSVLDAGSVAYNALIKAFCDRCEHYRRSGDVTCLRCPVHQLKQKIHEWEMEVIAGGEKG